MCVSRLREEKERAERAYAEIEERFRPYMDQVDSLEELNKLLQSQTALAQMEVGPSCPGNPCIQSYPLNLVGEGLTIIFMM